jgi:hypothetical protein
MTFALYTQCYGKYSRYLPEWEQMVSAISPAPDEVVIVGDGLAEEAWSGTGKFVLANEFGNPFRQADSANFALSLLSSEWVTHVGVDDIPLPNLVSLAFPFVDSYDVVAYDNIHISSGTIGGRRANVPSAESVLDTSRGRAALDACAWYRKSLWESAPYDSNYEGAVDVSFWIRHAGLGARFVGSRQLGILYRIHEDSLWHSRPKEKRSENFDKLNILRQSYIDGKEVEAQ